MNDHSALMLNASNLESMLTYPYAFVQVSEIADRHGIGITRRDLFGIPQTEWPDHLRGLLDEFDPEMILITLRNTDTMVAAEYETSAETAHLVKSGFKGGWYDVISLDDVNLETMKSPYSRDEIVRDVLRGVQVPIQEYGDPEIDSYSRQERILANKPKLDPGSFFLGNPAVTVETIRETIRIMAETGLARVYESAGIVKATRVFDFLELEGELLRHTWSRRYDGERGEYSELYPSFSYPPALIDHFGNTDEVVELFDLLKTTFLSSKHLYDKEWGKFLGKQVNRDRLAVWWADARASDIDPAVICEIPEVVEFLELLLKGKKELSLLFDTTASDAERYDLVNFSAHMAIRYILLANQEQLRPVVRCLGLSGNLQEVFELTPYEMAKPLFARFESKEALIASLDVCYTKPDLEEFCAEYLLYLHNVPLKPNYREFFVEKGDASDPLAMEESIP